MGDVIYRPVFSVGLHFFATGMLTAQVTVQQHIAHIENVLLPTVLVKGEPVKTKKLADFMAERHLPGVSVAYLHYGKIEWIRGFGLTSLGADGKARQLVLHQPGQDIPAKRK